MPSEPDAYDVVAYPAFAYPATHPDTLAVMGLLHGLEPAPVEHCRVLEVGCNEGANLIPMAYAIPGGKFVGFDLAGLPIARGRQRIQELGLSNVELFQANLMEIGESLGTFDYILAHGVYAWVGEPIRQRLLALCRQHLAPNGIAFISYNALPGGHFRNVLRDILLQGMAGSDDSVQSVSQAFEFLRFITDSRPQGDPFRILLEKELKRVEKRGPHVIYHDELSGEHRPVSFAGFIASAAGNGLQYLSESSLPPPNDPCYKPHLVETARLFAHEDPIAQEQILDVIRMRRYRETLLCQAECTVSSDLSLEMLGRLRLASRAASTSGGAGTASRVFTLAHGSQIESHHPAAVALMEQLIDASPQSIPFPQLAESLAAKGIALDAAFFTLLFQLVVSHMVELHAWAAPLSSTVAALPRASASARQEAAASEQVTTLLHTALELHDPLVRQLLLLLDGTRDRAALLQALRNQHPELPEATLAEGLEATLRDLNLAGVLLSEDFV